LPILTIRDALRAARQLIDPLDAHVLLGEVLGVDRAYLIAHPEITLTPDHVERFARFMKRCAAGEPVAYILGRRAFYDRTFTITPAVLIPRPETELLLERALEWAGDRALTAVDVGTGSGALAVTLAAKRPEIAVHAVDISPTALHVARQNAQQQRVKVTFYEGDLLKPLIARAIKPDLVMANLPYIASDELRDLPVSRYEPRLALDGGADGLVLIRRLLAQIPQAANTGALVLLEIGAGQGAAVLSLVRQGLAPKSAQLILDYAGLDRIIEVAL